MTTITAQQILDENNYTIDDISLINLEYLIDNAIDYVNLQTGLTISNMSGDTPGSKSTSVTSNQAPIIKSLAALLLRAYKDRGPNVTLPGAGVATLTADPQYSLFMKLIDEGIVKLRGVSFKRT